jgi:hypothetical protein
MLTSMDAISREGAGTIRSGTLADAGVEERLASALLAICEASGCAELDVGATAAGL